MFLSYRFRRLLHGVARTAVFLLTLRWWFVGFDLSFSAGCLFVSGIWLLITWASLDVYLKSYANVMARLNMLIPVWLGLSLSGIVLWESPLGLWTGLGALSFAAWSVIYTKYRLNRRQYDQVGSGPVLKGTKVCPGIESLQAGDLIASGGGARDISKMTAATAAHGELIIEGMDPEDPLTYGKLFCLSSYMAHGVVLNPLEKILHIYKTRGHYFAMRPTVPLTLRQKRMLWDGAQIMLADNARYKDMKRKRTARVSQLYQAWLPGFARTTLGWLFNRLPTPAKLLLGLPFADNGYDWKGLVTGRPSDDRWTCIGACKFLYKKAGVPLKPSGEGVFGLGTGWFDPLTVVTFLYDPALALLKDEDYKPEPTRRATWLEYLGASLLAVTDVLKTLKKRILRKSSRKKKSNSP